LLKRVLIGLTTGYIIFYYGELVFWATPEREGMAINSIIITWLAYSVMAYVFLCVVSVFKVRSVWAVFLAGAFYGWFEEGIVVQTMYGTPDGPFPMSISFTGLAWHALIDVFVGWYLVRKALAESGVVKVIGLASAIGLFYGLWGIWWWNEPPASMKAMLDEGQTDVLLIRFAVFALCTSSLLVLAHWLYGRVMPFVFQPSKVELWLFGVVAVLYYSFITVPAQPRAIWVLPPLMAITFLALNKNRLMELQPDAISAFDRAVEPHRYLLLFFIPFVAIGIYFLALAAGVRIHTNMVVYYLFGALGALMWISSVVMLLKRRLVADDDDRNAEPGAPPNGSPAVLPGNSDFRGGPPIVLAQPPIASQPRERALHYPTTGQHLKPFGPLGTLHGFQGPTAPLERPLDQRSVIVALRPQQPQPGEAMRQWGQHPACPLRIRHLRRMDHHGQQQTQGIDDEMAFPAGDLLPSVLPAVPSLFHSFDGLTVDAARTGSGIASFGLVHLGPQGLVDAFQGAILPPPTEIVVNGSPRGEVVGQHPPGTAAAQHIQEGIDDRPQVDGAGSASRFGGRQQGLQQGPLLVLQIGRVVLSFHKLRSIPQKLPLFKHALTRACT